MSTVSIRYIANDVPRAVEFYVELLGFTVVMQPAPGFAMLSRGDLRLLLNAPGAGGGGQGQPVPGGWNRFQLEVEDLEDVLATLRDSGAVVRSGVVEGNGGRQAVVDDPDGNPVELFQPFARVS